MGHNHVRLLARSRGRCRMTATVMTADDIRRALTRIAHEILERDKGADDVVLVGIADRGDDLARRLAAEIARIEGPRCRSACSTSPSIATTSVCVPRRPRSTRRGSGSTSPARSWCWSTTCCTRAARSARRWTRSWTSVGPARSSSPCWWTAGHRELPIRADFVGKNVPTSRTTTSGSRSQEVDGADAVTVRRAEEGRGARGAEADERTSAVDARPDGRTTSRGSWTPRARSGRSGAG